MRVSYKNPRVILLLYSFYLIVYLICISYFIYSYYIYLYLICISFDKISFIGGLFPYLYDDMWFIFMILGYTFIIDILFFMFVFGCISLLSMMLLYNDPYVVIGIYFHFMFFGFYDNIWDSMFFYFSYIISMMIFYFVCVCLWSLTLCDNGFIYYHWPMIIFFSFYVFVWGYGYIILVIWGIELFIS